MKTVSCSLTGETLLPQEAYKGSLIRRNIFDLIAKEHPGFNEESFIGVKELNKYRRKYLEQIIKQELGEIQSLEKEVIKSIADQELLVHTLEKNIDQNLSLPQKLADKVAAFGGSWGFIVSFFCFMLCWIMINVFFLSKGAFDPYPFILLNLILSCLAAIQAPIIMMSQNRQEEKDRIRNEHDYKINLKAELEIRLLHEKMDHLIIHQNQRFAEIQALQADYMEDILNKISSSTKN